jgi:hypothetical protein
VIFLEILSVFAPIATVIGGAAYRRLGRIETKIDTLGRNDFTQDLHLLDHEQRLAELGSPRWSHR